MKKIKSVLFALFVFIIVIFPVFNVSAAVSGRYYPFNIENYDVKIDVAEDNILHVTENIDVNFNEAQHGIYRTIPRRFNVEREDGSISNAKIKVKHFRCSDNYNMSTTGDEYSIRIGDSDETITGRHTYQLSYDYIIGVDLLDGADEFYFNIIGTEWETTIENVTFEINMPKEFDSSKLGFSAGFYGATGTEAVDYSVDGNTITGKMTMPLGYREGLTTRLELPEGYFQIDTKRQNMSVVSLITIPAVVLLAVLIIWAKFGKDKKIVDVVEFYPPEGMNCVDVAYWYKGAVTGEDVVPLLIELANEGYLTINDNKTGSYVIKKIKSYDGDDESKKTFMNGLFMRGETTYKSRLEKDFYVYIDMIRNSYNTHRNRRKVFVNHSLTMRIVCWAVIIGFIFVNCLIFEDSYQTAPCIYALIGGFVIYLCAFILSFFVRKRTDDGHRMLQMINGFKIFLETAEKEKLEALVEDDPQYFYNILPYTYVLGVSKKWVEKFESIAVEPPVWCTSDYRGLGYIYFINSTFRDCSRAMLVRPVETGDSSGHSLGGGSGVSGGGFSGGGVSGGGFGGGGGGSW